MIACSPELVLKPPLSILPGEVATPLSGVDASYSQLEHAARGRALTKPCWLPYASSSLYSVPLPI
jgi:hypothetical protein